MANNTAKIAELEAILQAGETSTTIDGTTTTVDLNVIRQQLNELRANDDDEANRLRKPTVATICLGGQW